MKKLRAQSSREIFRFFELPGGKSIRREEAVQIPDELLEIRNRIYEFAFSIAYQTFPTSTFIQSGSRKSRKASQLPEKTHHNQPIPFLGLVQSCRQIRKEFRTWWMSAHQIPVDEFRVRRYLSTFFPVAGLARKILKASNSCPHPAGSLRVLLAGSSLSSVELIPLMQHKHRYPEFVISFESSVPAYAPAVKIITDLVNNNHPKWRRWLQAKAISQFRYRYCGVYRPACYLVIKSDFAEDWMRPNIKTAYPGWLTRAVELLVAAGIEPGLFGDISWGVDYT